MNEYDLFDAFSGIDDELLSRSEHKTTRRIPFRKALIAAAAVMLLAATAVASPEIQNWVRGFTMTRVSIGEIVRDGEFDGYREGFARIDLNLEGIGETPQTIEELRIPTYFESGGWDYTEDIRYPNTLYSSYYGIWQRQMDNDIGGQYLIFNQMAIYPACDPYPAGHGQFALDLGYDSDVEQRTLTIDDRSYRVYLVGASSLKPLVEFLPHIDVIWSDGEYAYKISTGGMDLDMIIKIIQSIEPTPMQDYVRDARFDPIETYYTLSTIPEDWVQLQANDHSYRSDQEWGRIENGTEIALWQHRDQAEGNDVQSESIESALDFAREDASTLQIETTEIDGMTVSIVRSEDHLHAYWHQDNCVFDLMVDGSPDISTEEICRHITGLVPVEDFGSLMPE